MSTSRSPSPLLSRGWQCPQCLDRDLRHWTCRCEPSNNHHGCAPMHPADSCNATCSICGWEDSYPSLPPDAPEVFANVAGAWLDLGFLPAEAVFLAWLQMDPTDHLATMAGTSAINKAGPFQVDAAVLLVNHGRLHVGESPLLAIEGVLHRLDLKDR